MKYTVINRIGYTGRKHNEVVRNMLKKHKSQAILKDGVWLELTESTSSAWRHLTTYSSAYVAPQSSSLVRNYERLSITRNNNF